MNKPNPHESRNAFAMGYLYSYREYKFLLDIKNWRGPLSPAQKQWLEYINRRISLRTVVRAFDSSDK